ncbi:Ti-type conjugative transfer relaxase TraA, partial [Methylobacterium sp. NEAU 140]|nr:Ti-type conjugative transfer relaxase TraA [Methylobacterium sp. NEAU 140]
GRDGAARRVSVPVAEYQAFDHGYATTIHKTQGATVDRSFVLASATMDRHLAYVAMTRHRDAARLYAAADEFAGREAGRLVAHGRAPYAHDPANRASYFVTLEDAAGARRTSWGADLERAMAAAQPALGATIGLERTGSAAVRPADGTERARQGWRVRDAAELAGAGLAAQLSRSGAKETTLDYPGAGEAAAEAFAARRGIAEALGIASEIAVPRQPERAEEAAPGRDAASAAERPRRSMFDGLKLGRRPPASRPQAEPAAPGREPAPRTRGMFDGLRLGVGPRVAAAARPDPSEVPSPEDRPADRLEPLSAFEAALDRYARAHSAAERHAAAGLPRLEGHARAVAEAGQALDTVRPGAHALVRSSLEHDPEAARAMVERTGRDRLGPLVAGLERERAALADPAVRADRFLARWQDLEAQRDALPGAEHAEARGAVEGRMRVLGRSLGGDPEASAVLRARAAEQERAAAQERAVVEARVRAEALARERERVVQRSRGQDLGLEM